MPDPGARNDHRRPPVCTPRIGVARLLWLRVVRPPGIVYFTFWPRYARVLTRWLRVPEHRMLAAYAALAGAPVRAVVIHEGSPRLNAEAMRAVGRITVELSGAIADQGWTEVLGAAIGETEALAYFSRIFPRVDVAPQAMAVATALAALDGRVPDVLWSPLWPADWTRVAQAELGGSFGVSFVRWPSGLPALLGALAGAWWASAAAALIGLRLGRRRGGDGQPRSADAQAWLATEFIDPRRFDGGAVDANFVEGERIGRTDVAYYLTPEQARVLRRAEVDPENALRVVRERGFHVVDLRTAGYSRRSAAVAARAAIGGLRRTGAPGAGCLGESFRLACRDLMTQLSMFDAVRPRAVLHTFTPNGHTELRLDSAIVTGLARRRGAQSIGYQNRATVARVFEEAFDCYDTYLAWAEGWRALSADGDRFIAQVAEVGCLENDGRPARAPHRHDRPVVTIFTSDLQSERFVVAEMLEFLGTCCELARAHPRCRFQVKTKDPHHNKVIRGDPIVGPLLRAIDNIELLERSRHDVADVLDGSDIVIALAWTTPGAAALMLERRLIFYDLVGGESPFDAFPDLIARTPDQLRALFDVALDDYPGYGPAHRAQLARLDPFRDGRPRERIIDRLLRAKQHGNG